MELMINSQRDRIWPGSKKKQGAFWYLYFCFYSDAIRLTFEERQVGLSRWSCRWITHCCCCRVTVRAMFRGYIWWQVCCLLESRRTLLNKKTKKKNKITTLHSVHIPLDSPFAVYGSLWWTGNLAATTTTTVNASNAQGHAMWNISSLCLTSNQYCRGLSL